MKTKIVFSTVGTSLLTNLPLEQEDKIFLIQTSNHKEPDYSLPDKERVDKIIAQAEQSLSKKPLLESKESSAEMAGLLGMKEFPVAAIYYFLATDTYQSTRVAEALCRYLKQNGFTQTNSYTVPGLSTRNTKQFTLGIKNLLGWFYDESNNFSDTHTMDVVFNLSGGFKATHGAMTAMGMLMGVEIVYTFQKAELITIPKMKLEMDIRFLKEDASLFLMLDFSTILPLEKWRQKVADNSLFFDVEGDQFSLSTWGILLWEKHKESILGEKLLGWSRLIYDDSFVKDFSGTVSKKERVKVQEVLAKVHCLLEQSNGSTATLKSDNGLEYGRLKNILIANDPVDHFYVTLGKRASCLSRDGKLTLRHYGAHDYVNDNP